MFIRNRNQIRLTKLLLALMLVSCQTPISQEVDFIVTNLCVSDTINVQYFAFESNDTNNVQIVPLESQTAWHVVKNPGESINWFDDFGIKINYIKNTIGDTINFNPNVASYWEYLSATTPNNYYILRIDESSF